MMILVGAIGMLSGDEIEVTWEEVVATDHICIT